MMSRLARRFPAPAVTAGTFLAAALATGLGIALTNAEGLVAKSFTTALSSPSGHKAGAPGSEAVVAGTEEFWLAGPGKDGRAGGRIEPAAWSAQAALGVVAVGDKITIASGGSQRVLEVVSVADLPASVTRVETDKASGGHQVLVTCRDTSGEQGSELIRFVSYAGPNAGSAAKPPRAL
jgi:hypothetical protein